MAPINLLPEEERIHEMPKKPGLSKWYMLPVLSLALAIIILDTTILNVALSSIIRDLNTDIQSIQWVITTYSLTLAALTITGGRLGDIFGRKRMFMLGAALFAVGSFIASISTSVPMLIIGESIIEGIGAALMMPATASLLVANFEGRERAIAFGVWGGIAGAAASLGPIVGGYLTTHYNWRWGFRINLFVVIVLLLSSFLIKESRDRAEKPELDWLGVFLSATGLLSFVFGIIEASRYGWWHAKEIFSVGGYVLDIPNNISIVPFAVVIGLVIITLFVLWERYQEKRNHTPLVSMSLFKNRQFTSGVITTCILSLGQTGLIFSLPVFLQAVRGYDAFHTGLSLLPMSLPLLIVAPLSAMLSKKIAPKFLVQLGLLCNVAAFFVLRYSISVDATSTTLIPGLMLFGIGMGLVMSQINNMTLSAVSVEEAGEASGVNNTLRQVGSTLGSAIMGTVLLASLATGMQNGVQNSSVIPDVLKQQVSQVIASQSSNVEFGGGAHVNKDTPPAIAEEIVRIGHQATVDANHESLLYGSLFAILGFLASFLLPKRPGKPQELSHQLVQETDEINKKNLYAHDAPLTTDMLSELISVDKHIRELGRAGIEKEIQYVVDELETGGSLLSHGNPRIIQARRLWDIGFGKALGYTDFKSYLETIPSAPRETQISPEKFPELVLVDSRLEPQHICLLLGIVKHGWRMGGMTAPVVKERPVYWIFCQNGERYLGKSVRNAKNLFEDGEVGLNEIEGLALTTQTPYILEDHYIDLPKTEHEFMENQVACLGTWGKTLGLRWRWNDYEDPRCGTATKHSIV